jgi:hypothetical protein
MASNTQSFILHLKHLSCSYKSDIMNCLLYILFSFGTVWNKIRLRIREDLSYDKAVAAIYFSRKF